MRIHILLASAAALSLAACGGTSADGSQSEAAASASVSDRDLEDQVLAALEDAPSHGLTRDLFLQAELPSDKGQRRDALLKAAKEYASALAKGKVDPTKVREIYTVARPQMDIDQAFNQALADNRFRDWANSLAPQTAEYQALSKAFVRLVKRSPDLPDSDIPSGDVIETGESDERVPLIVSNLQALGYLPEGGPQQQQFSGATFTPAMSQALARFQADSGLKSDGVAGPGTIEALNDGPRDRARTLAVALERLRWLEREPPATRIDVNTAATVLDYYRDGRHRDRRKVVAGEPGWETPQLGSPMFRLVANPDWTVPESIVEDEISKKGSAWLARNNFVQKDGQWVQQPGPDNALGEVKLDMKNDHAIYLHDTPAKALFDQPERHRSHGCVRVEDAVGFARTIAQHDGILDKFNQAMASGERTFVDLNADIPVRLMYHTAYLDSDGRVHFAQDVYGWDNDVAEALGYERRERAAARHSPGDVGP